MCVWTQVHVRILRKRVVCICVLCNALLLIGAHIPRWLADPVISANAPRGAASPTLSQAYTISSCFKQNSPHLSHEQQRCQAQSVDAKRSRWF